MTSEREATLKELINELNQCRKDRRSVPFELVEKTAKALGIPVGSLVAQILR